MKSTDAIADLTALIPEYKSKTEEQWAQLGDAILADELGVPVAVQYYEPVAFYIPSGRYKPDFAHFLEDGRIVFVEVKASKKQKGYRSSRQKLRETANVYPMFTWVMAVKLEVEVI